MNQPTLFEQKSTDTEKIVLYALGDFQSRGKVLADRELALDRLRGAFIRACKAFGAQELSDDMIAEQLGKIGAVAKKVPNFVAKHPFRVTVPQSLAERALEFYNQVLD